MASLIPKSKSKKQPTLLLPKPSSKKGASSDALKKALKSNSNARTRIGMAGESDPTKKKGASALEKIFGALDTPGTAVRTFLHNTLNTASDKDLSIGGETMKSLKGEKHPTGADILDDMGVKNKWGKMLGGFLFDVVTDPVTYLSFGTSGLTKSAGTSIVGKLARGGDLTVDALKGMGVADDVIRAVLPYADDAKRIVAGDLPKEVSQELMQGVYRALGDMGGVKFAGISLGGQRGVSKLGYKAKDVLRKIPGAKWAEQAFGHGDLTDAFREGNEVMNAALTMARRDLSGKLALGDHLGQQFFKKLADAVPDEAARMDVTLAIGKQLKDPENAAVVREALEAAGLKGDDLTKALDLADAFSTRMEDLLTAQRTAGVDVADLTAGTGKGYIPGATAADRGAKGNKAYQELLGEKGFAADELVDPAAPKMSQFRKKLIPGENKSKTYLTPEDRLLGITREGDETAKLSTELDIARLGGKAERDAQGRIALSEYQDELKNILGDDKDLTELMSNVEQVFTNDEATKGFLKAYDKVLNGWKAMATSYNVSFPLRNAQSNVFLRYTEGLLDLTGKADQEAFRLVKDVMRGSIKEADSELIQEMVRNRVFTNSDEIAEIVGGARRSFMRDNLIGKTGGKVNEMVENQARAAAYIVAKKRAAGLGLKGEAAENAASMLVDKALYNYDPKALTAFERNVMKRIVPFYTWMRRNTPHIVELLAKSPGKLAPVGHLKDNSFAASPVNMDVMPDWMRDTYPISLPVKFGGQQTLLSTAGVMPVGDLEKLNLIREGKLDLRDAIGSVSPLIKTPLELIFNKDIYFGDEITRYPGETRRAPGFVEKADDLFDAFKKDLPEVYAAWSMFKDTFGIIEKKDSITGEPYVAMPSAAVKVIRDASPWLNNIGKIMSDAPRAPYDRAAFFSGLRFMGFDEQRFERQQTFDDQAELQAAMARLRAEGRLPDLPKKSSPKKLSLIPTKRGDN